MMNALYAMNRVANAFIRPMVFFILGEIIYFMWKGIEVTYGCY